MVVHTSVSTCTLSSSSVEDQAQLISELLEFYLPKVLGKEVSWVFTTLNIEEFDLSLCNEFTDGIEAYVYVLIPRFCNWIA